MSRSTPFRFARISLALALGALVMSQVQARSDASFMKQAAQNGNAEIEASKLAQTKARSADVKSFAESMVADHTRVADELKQLAASKKVELPAEPSVQQRAELKMISAGDDAKFDRRYADSFGVKAHKETIKLFQDAAKNAKDADVRAWAQKTLPGLQHHLEMAQSLSVASKK